MPLQCCRRTLLSPRPSAAYRFNIGGACARKCSFYLILRRVVRSLKAVPAILRFCRRVVAKRKMHRGYGSCEGVGCPTSACALALVFVSSRWEIVFSNLLRHARSRARLLVFVRFPLGRRGGCHDYATWVRDSRPTTPTTTRQCCKYAHGVTIIASGSCW